MNDTCNTCNGPLMPIPACPECSTATAADPHRYRELWEEAMRQNKHLRGALDRIAGAGTLADARRWAEEARR